MKIDHEGKQIFLEGLDDPVAYDVLVIATGGTVPFPAHGGPRDKAEAVEEYNKFLAQVNATFINDERLTRYTTTTTTSSSSSSSSSSTRPTSAFLWPTYNMQTFLLAGNGKGPYHCRWWWSRWSRDLC